MINKFMVDCDDQMIEITRDGCFDDVTITIYIRNGGDSPSVFLASKQEAAEIARVLKRMSGID